MHSQFCTISVRIIKAVTQVTLNVQASEYKIKIEIEIVAVEKFDMG